MKLFKVRLFITVQQYVDVYVESDDHEDVESLAYDQKDLNWKVSKTKINTGLTEVTEIES